ncbi:MAG: hypothetical protein KDJ88_00395 [Bauldia sp.]|nr:hypothetical protein [Bauldia sp.]
MTQNNAQSGDMAGIARETLRAESNRRLDQLFARFGDRIADLTSDDSIESLLDQKNREIDYRNETISYQQVGLEDLEKQLSDLREVQAKDRRQLHAAEAKTAERNQVIASQTRQLRRRASRMEALKRQNARLKDDKASLQRTRARLQRELSKLRNPFHYLKWLLVGFPSAKRTGRPDA